MGEALVRQGNDGMYDARMIEYVSGLWLRDLHYGLLWHLDPGTKLTGKCDIAPSWSWTSVFAKVRWPQRHSAPGVRLDLRLHHLRFKYWDKSSGVDATLANNKGKRKASDEANTQPVIETFEVEVPCVNDQLARFPMPSMHPAELFDVNSVCTQLTAETKVLEVHVGEALDFQSKWSAMLATGYLRGDPSGVGNYSNRMMVDQQALHTIALMEAPSQLAGWGSFERLVPGPSDENGNEVAGTATYVTRVFAVLIATRYLADALAFGFLAFKRPVHDVIFCQRHGEMYERIGVGSLFDKTMIKSFYKLETDIVHLI